MALAVAGGGFNDSGQVRTAEGVHLPVLDLRLVGR